MSNITIDLDILVEKKEKIVLNGKEFFLIEPPLEMYFKLSKLGEKLNSGDYKDISEMESTIQEVKNAFGMVIPGIENETMNMAQMARLVTLITDSVKPDDLKALESQGIELKTDDPEIQKKTTQG